MALSGNFETNWSTYVGGARAKFRFSWTGTQSINNNTTTISWSLVATTDPTGYSRGVRKVVVNFNGSDQYVNVWPYNSMNKVTTGTTLASGNTIVGHNADGSKSLTFTVKVNVGYSDENTFNCTATNSVTLNTIPRAATITATPAVIESGNLTITATPPNTTFSTTVSYTVNGSTTTLWTKQTGTKSQTVSYVTLAGKIGSFTSGVVTVTCQTYNGNTLVGTSTTQATIQTGKIPMSWYDTRQGSVGVTVGEKATGPGFNVKLDSKFTTDGGVTLGGVMRDYVVETGFNNSGGYMLYNSGLIEMWGWLNLSKVTTGAGTYWQGAVTFPKELASTAGVSLQATQNIGITMVYNGYGGPVTYQSLSTTGVVLQSAMYSSSTGVMTVNWLVRGKAK